jgi:hypothetical protein
MPAATASSKPAGRIASIVGARPSLLGAIKASRNQDMFDGTAVAAFMQNYAIASYKFSMPYAPSTQSNVYGNAAAVYASQLAFQEQLRYNARSRYN